LASDLEEVTEELREENRKTSTDSSHRCAGLPGTDYIPEMRRIINEEEKKFLVLFGTGWGMQAELIQDCDLHFKPVELERDYNHLSVRSAVSIILDRLLGENWFVK
jgi:hypothetical protein